MHVFGLIFLFLSLPLLAAREITTQIYDIDYGQKKGDEVLVLLRSGDVARLHHSNPILSKDFMSSEARNKWFTFILDDQRFITELKEAEVTSRTTKERNFFAPQSYVMTTIANMDLAKKYFREARYNPKDSQCFNRAMVWTYEWWKNHSLKSGKLLVFFTRNYIRRYNFEWWFHITPYVHVMDNGKVVERTMDVKYTRGPLEFGRWTNIFMRNDAPCPVITKFSEYADSPYTGECYIQRTHMYTYQPADLQMYEAWGYHKEEWNMTEVRQAYLEAFDEHI